MTGNIFTHFTPLSLGWTLCLWCVSIDLMRRTEHMWSPEWDINLIFSAPWVLQNCFTTTVFVRPASLTLRCRSRKSQKLSARRDGLDSLFVFYSSLRHNRATHKIHAQQRELGAFYSISEPPCMLATTWKQLSAVLGATSILSWKLNFQQGEIYV